MKPFKAVIKGFTLIELVIVIVLLSVLGIMTTNYIKTGTDIYIHTVNIDKSIGNVRFIMERLRREMSNALPNSLIVTDKCLTFTPIIDSSFYGDDFPIHPQVANYGFISPISKNLKGTKAVIDLATTDELLEEGVKVQTVRRYDSIQGKLSFNKNVSFSSSSPTKRIYFIKDNIHYCFNDSNLYKRTNSNQNILMAENITGKFVIKEAVQNVLQVTFTMQLDQEEVSVEQILRINNKQ